MTWLFSLCALPRMGTSMFLGNLDVEVSMKLGILPSADSPLKPLPPSQDPWYTAPPDFEHASPGSVLRLRLAPGNITSVVKSSSAALNILYRTTDTHDRPAWAVTTLLLPEKYYVSPSGQLALLSYQFAYDSANVDNSPSYSIFSTLTESDLGIGISSNTGLLELLLSQGWIVNTPDYEGPTAALGASVQAGHATLDAQRAVLNLRRLIGARERLTVALWGYSGGSIATEAAAELQPYYAPDLAIGGVAAGGLVEDLSADFEYLNQSPLAGHIASMVLGITAQYPQARAYVLSRLRPETAGEFTQVLNMTLEETLGFFSMRDMYGYFVGGKADLHVPELTRVYAREKLGGHGTPAVPMYLYKAIHDEYCPIEQTDELVRRYCAAGVEILFERNTVGGHVSEIENGKPRAMQWLWSVFDGSYRSPHCGCKIRDVTVQVGK